LALTHGSSADQSAEFWCTGLSGPDDQWIVAWRVSGLYWCAYIPGHCPHAVKCHQRDLELDVSRTVGVTSTSSRWMNVVSESRAALDRRTRQHLLQNFTEVAELQIFMANIRRRRRRQHALLQPSRRRTRQVCRRWCQSRMTQDFVTWQG